MPSGLVAKSAAKIAAKRISRNVFKEIKPFAERIKATKVGNIPKEFYAGKKPIKEFRVLGDAALREKYKIPKDFKPFRSSGADFPKVKPRDLGAYEDEVLYIMQMRKAKALPGIYDKRLAEIAIGAPDLGLSKGLREAQANFVLAHEMGHAVDFNLARKVRKSFYKRLDDFEAAEKVADASNWGTRSMYNAQKEKFADSFAELLGVSHQQTGRPTYKPGSWDWKRMKDIINNPTKYGFTVTGLIGGLAAMGVFGPDEAQAAPAGIYQKAGKFVKKGISSAAQRFKGFEIAEGKVIKDIVKGRGSNRALIFEDGTEMVITKKEVNDLSRELGRRRYLNNYARANEGGKTSIAIKSMEKHESLARMAQHMPDKPKFTRDVVRQMQQSHVRRTKNITEPTNMVYVSRGGLFYTMPKEYAERLERTGILKIVKKR